MDSGAVALTHKNSAVFTNHKINVVVLSKSNDGFRKEMVKNQSN
jgi:hypothetical protein